MMNVGDLKARLADLPDDGEVFVYVGPDGVTVQAEYKTDAYHATEAVVLSSPTAIPVGGGPCEVGTDETIMCDRCGTVVPESVGTIEPDSGLGFCPSCMGRLTELAEGV